MYSFGQLGENDGEIDSPMGLTFNREGDLVICDFNNHRIQVVSREGAFVCKFGVHGSEVGQLDHPVAVLCHPLDGSYVVVDRGNHRIQAFSSESKSVLLQFGGFGAAEGKMHHPGGIAIDQRGNYVVSDTGNHRIQFFTPNGDHLRSFGKAGRGTGEFNQPAGILFDRDNNLVVSDWQNHRIVWLQVAEEISVLRHFGSSGSLLGQLSFPYGVACDQWGRILIAEGKNHRVQVVAADAITSIGCQGTGHGQFRQPRFICCHNPTNTVFISDRLNNRIQVFSLAPNDSKSYLLSSHWKSCKKEAELRAVMKTGFDLLPPISLEDLLVGEKLGNGASGTVFQSILLHPKLSELWTRASNRLEPLSVAVKMKMPPHLSTSKLRRLFENEHRTLEILPAHENIVTLYSHFVEKPTNDMIDRASTQMTSSLRDEIYYHINHVENEKKVRTTQFLVMECHPMNLAEYMTHKGRVSTAKVAHLALQLAKGLAHLFVHRYLHLDIRPQNLLVSQEGELVIADFGANVAFTNDQTLDCTTIVEGNPQHLSPEVIAGISRSETIDITYQNSWELGCVLWYMITGEEHPYPGYPSISSRKELMQHNICGQLQRRNFDLPLLKSSLDQLAALAVNLLNWHPADRPKINDACLILADLRTSIAPKFESIML